MAIGFAASSSQSATLTGGATWIGPRAYYQRAYVNPADTYTWGYEHLFFDKEDQQPEYIALIVQGAGDSGTVVRWGVRINGTNYYGTADVAVTAGWHDTWVDYDHAWSQVLVYIDDPTTPAITVSSVVFDSTGGTRTYRWGVNDSGSGYLTGKLDPVRVWTKLLDSAGKAAEEASRSAVDTASLALAYENPHLGTLGEDLVGANDMTLNNSPTDELDSTYAGPSSLDCDAGTYTLTGNNVGMNVNETVITQDLWTTTFTYEGDRQSGQFSDGSYWIEGPVDWVSEDPVFAVDGGGRDRFGTTIDPTYDSNRGGWSPGRLLHGFGTIQQPGGYSIARNASYDLTLGTVTITPASGSYVSLVKCINAATYDPLNASDDAEAFRIVTVVASDRIPSGAEVMRPWVAGPTKQAVYHTTDEIQANLDHIPEMDAVLVRSNSGHRDTIAAMFTSGPILDLDGSTWQGQMLPHVTTGIGNYQRNVVSHISEAYLFAASTLRTDALLNGLVQLGQDIYGNILNGCMYPDGGGHVHGREIQVNFAGNLLGDADMDTNALLAAVGEFRGTRMQWFYVEETSAGVYNYGRPQSGDPGWNGGNGAYTVADVGLPEWGGVHLNFDPAGVGSTYDSNTWTEGNPYRTCCTANSYWGLVLVSRKMGLDETWCPALFDYMTRFHDTEYARVGYDWTLDFAPSQWTVKVFEDEGFTGPAASLACDTGVYSLTGRDMFLVEQPGLHCDAGTYSLTGVDVALGDNGLVCASGVYTFLGYDVGIGTNTLDCESGIYLIVGMQAIIGGNHVHYFYYNDGNDDSAGALDMDYRQVVAITPSNTVGHAQADAVFSGSGGDIAVVPPVGSVFVLKNIPAGVFVRVRNVRVNSTGTTATDTAACYK